MNLLSPNVFIVLYQIASFTFLLLVVVTLIKFLNVLFKADHAIDEIREYIRRQS